jgi:hypothetical protein
MTMIAEGIESCEELAYLQGANRISYAQATTSRVRSFSKNCGPRSRSPAKRAAASPAARRRKTAKPAPAAADTAANSRRLGAPKRCASAGSAGLMINKENARYSK